MVLPNNKRIQIREVKSNSRPEPVHPFDPKKPCDPYDDGKGGCPEPSICKEKLKNPMKPHETRCKGGAYLGITSCAAKRAGAASKAETHFHHPCDTPEPCVSGNPAKKPCSDVVLFKEKIKNPEPVLIRCPSPEDLISKFLCEPKVDCEED